MAPTVWRISLTRADGAGICLLSTVLSTYFDENGKPSCSTEEDPNITLERISCIHNTCQIWETDEVFLAKLGGWTDVVFVMNAWNAIVRRIN
jgi:hypothetical protein